MGSPTGVTTASDLTLYALSDPLVLAGHYFLVVLKGAVEVNGTVIEASLREIPVSCPLPPFYAIKPARSFVQASYLANDSHRDAATVVGIKPNPLTNFSKLASPFKSLFPELTVVSDRPELQPFKSWKSLSSQIDHGHKVVLLGPKNSGKSSLGRYLINQRIAKNQHVYYLDLDPGQGEFTPPGTLALCKVTDFVFGPPYSHCGFDNVVKAHSLGYVSPMDTPARYLDIFRDLYDKFLSVAENETLIVNTPGWTKGLGLELNSDVCLSVTPDFLCHMGNDEGFQDFTEATKDACDHIVAVDAVDIGENAPRFSAAELRVAQSMAYFHKTNQDHLTTWNPYKLPYGKDGIYALSVLDSDGIDLAQDAQVCTEGTIVAIAACDSPPPISDFSMDIPFVTSDVSMELHKVSECVGYAVIQYMSPDFIRLLTPLDPAVIGNRSVILVRGRLKLPIWEIWDQTSSSPAPWLSSRAAGGLGGSQLKFRRNLQRR